MGNGAGVTDTAARAAEREAIDGGEGCDLKSNPLKLLAVSGGRREALAPRPVTPGHANGARLNRTPCQLEHHLSSDDR